MLLWAQTVEITQQSRFLLHKNWAESCVLLHGRSPGCLIGWFCLDKVTQKKHNKHTRGKHSATTICQLRLPSHNSSSSSRCSLTANTHTYTHTEWWRPLTSHRCVCFIHQSRKLKYISSERLTTKKNPTITTVWSCWGFFFRVEAPPTSCLLQNHLVSSAGSARPVVWISL